MIPWWWLLVLLVVMWVFARLIPWLYIKRSVVDKPSVAASVVRADFYGENEEREPTVAEGRDALGDMNIVQTGAHPMGVSYIPESALEITRPMRPIRPGVVNAFKALAPHTPSFLAGAGKLNPRGGNKFGPTTKAKSYGAK